MPISAVPIEEPHVPADLLLKGLSKAGSGRKRKGDAATGGNDDTKKFGQTRPRKRTRDSDCEGEDEDESDAGGVGAASEDLENPCQDKRDSVTFAPMKVPTICPCGEFSWSAGRSVADHPDGHRSPRLRV